MVEQGTENPRVGGSIPSLATFFVGLLAGCGALGRDDCENLCIDLRRELRPCLVDWPVGWEIVDATSAADFENQCKRSWTDVRTELETRELADALDQCAETSAALDALADPCPTLRALYVVGPP